jgi:hypothetical protein
MARVLMGPHGQPDRPGRAAAGRVQGEGLEREGRLHEGRREAVGVGEPGAPARAWREAFEIVFRRRRHSPDRQLERLQRRRRREAVERHPGAVVGPGAQLERAGDRDVQAWNHESEPSELTGAGDQEVHRGGA